MTKLKISKATAPLFAALWSILLLSSLVRGTVSRTSHEVMRGAGGEPVESQLVSTATVSLERKRSASGAIQI